MVIRVSKGAVVTNNDKKYGVSNVVVPGKQKGALFTMANGGKSKDQYDGLYCLLYQIAKFKVEGKMPDNVMAIREGEGHPMSIAMDLLAEKRLGETE